MYPLKFKTSIYNDYHLKKTLIKMEKILVSGWNNGKHDSRGNGYGIRVGKKNRYLFKGITKFVLSIDGNETIKVSLTQGF